MILIEALKASILKPVESSSKASPLQKSNETVSQEVEAFSKLLATISTEDGNKVEAGQQQEVAEKLEELANSLQGLSEEALEALQEIAESLLSQEDQATQTSAELLLPISNFNILSKFPLYTSHLKKPKMDGQEVQQNLIQTLHQLTGAGADSAKITSNLQSVLTLLENADQTNSKLTTLIEQLEVVGEPGKSTLVQQLKHVQQALQEIQQMTAEVDEVVQLPKSNHGVQMLPTKVVQGLGEASGQGFNNLEVEVDNPTNLVAGQATDVKATQATAKMEAPQAAPTVRMSNLIEELSSVFRGSFKLNGTEQGTQLRVNIFPEQFGHLDIRLTSIEGKIQAQIFTSNLMAKEALDQQLSQLRQAMNQQGIVVDRIEVSHQNQQQSFNQFANSDQRFAQQQQKQGPLYKQKNGYSYAEEELAIENNRSQPNVGLTKVDYTI